MISSLLAVEFFLLTSSSSDYADEFDIFSTFLLLFLFVNFVLSDPLSIQRMYTYLDEWSPLSSFKWEISLKEGNRLQK